MGTTLKCKWFIVGEGDHKISKEFATSVGWSNAIESEEPFFVELRDVPNVLDHLLESADTTFDIIDITPGGLNFYFASGQEGDGLVLVPWNNVIAIHCVSPALSRDLRQWKGAAS